MHFVTIASLFAFLLVVSTASAARLQRATSTFQNEALKAANTRRAAHCSPPLRLDPELSRIAQKRADEICQTENFATANGRFRGKSLGENLYRLQKDEPMDLDSRPASEAITSWYSERKNYDFDLSSPSDDTGSFTQLVWASSKLVGFGVCLSSDEKTMFVVGKFFPEGNDVGLHEVNIKPTSCQ